MPDACYLMPLARRFALLVSLLLAGCASSTDETVTIYAAASLREVVTEIAREWSARTGRKHELQFESTSTLARQVNEGAPAHVFIAAAPEWLDKVKTQERFDWLSNRLVCVVPKNVTDFDLKRIDSLALADEQVPAGKYARQALAKEGLPLPARTIYGHNVRDVLSKVSKGGAKVGIVYATEAKLDPGVRIAHEFPPDRHDRIVYSAGLLKPEGKAFFDALREPGSMAIAKRYDFVD
jgi:molybdate transport system substrate-binding protein